MNIIDADDNDSIQTSSQSEKNNQETNWTKNKIYKMLLSTTYST